MDKKVIFRTSEDLHARLKERAAIERTTLAALLNRAARDLLATPTQPNQAGRAT